MGVVEWADAHAKVAEVVAAEIQTNTDPVVEGIERRSAWYATRHADRPAWISVVVPWSYSRMERSACDHWDPMTCCKKKTRTSK